VKLQNNREMLPQAPNMQAIFKCLREDLPALPGYRHLLQLELGLSSEVFMLRDTLIRNIKPGFKRRHMTPGYIADGARYSSTRIRETGDAR
jgi:hypothetical protein